MKPVHADRYAPSATARAGILAVLFFISGAVALAYEVVWQRQFALVLGSAAPATVAVLAAYFAGLGFGSAMFGRWARRWSRPLRAYAILEAGIGLGALMVTPLMEVLEGWYLSLVRGGVTEAGALLALRLGVVFGAIFIPTFCMGGTLPVLADWVDRGRRHLGVTAGWLYVANTVGAAVGALFVPFGLLPGLGLSGTVGLGAGVNGALALAAWILDGRAGKVSAIAETTPPARGAEFGRNGVEWMAAVSGAVTFALQVWWNRAFAQVHENSMHSFAVVVALVILALAAGAQLARMGLRRGWAPRRMLAWAWALAGVAVMAGPWLFYRWTGGLAYLPSGDTWTGQLARLMGLGFGVCFGPMMLLGVGFPALMEEAGRRFPGAVAGALGRLMAMNIAGSVAGALLAGFVLPDAVGLWGGLIWAGALVIGVAGWCGGRGVWRWSMIAAVAVAAGLGRVEPPRVRISAEREEKILSVAEGAHGIVAVVEREGSRRLKLNNHYALGGTAATGDERMQAHLPLLLHARPRSAAFLGLGTGVTAGGAGFHPLERIVAVELVPEVIAAARAYFREANAGVLEDARVRVVADDARHFLRGTEERFDVIVGDLVVPWRAGEGALYTREQFEAARAALEPGGLFCQWLPLFQLSEVETEILLRTFLSVFPRAEVWRGDFSPTEPALALVGRMGEGATEVAAVRERIAAMAEDPANPHLRAPGASWMHFVGSVGPEDLRAEETRVNTEDRPWIEMLGPRLHGGRSDAVFVGRSLETWLATVRERSRRRGLNVGEEEMRAMDAGAALAEMILAMKEGDRAGAERAREAMARLLPEETMRALLGGE